MERGSDRDYTSSQDIFINAWQTYRKVLTNNYMYHKEVYKLLREILVFEVDRPLWSALPRGSRTPPAPLQERAPTGYPRSQSMR